MVTSFKIIFVFLSICLKLSLPIIYPPSSVIVVNSFELFKTKFLLSTLKSLYLLWLNPLSFGVAISTRDVPLLVTSTLVIVIPSTTIIGFP